jgi:hypothetical protein
MGRVEAAIFASAEPVLHEKLARVVGKTCNLDLIIDDIRDELRDRPYEIVKVAGGVELSHQTRVWTRDPDRARGFTKERIVALECALADGNCLFSADHAGGIVAVSGERSSRDAIATLRAEGLIAAGPRSPTLGALRLCHPRGRSSPTSGSNPCATCRTSRNSRRNQRWASRRRGVELRAQWGSVGSIGRRRSARGRWA